MIKYETELWCVCNLTCSEIVFTLWRLNISEWLSHSCLCSCDANLIFPPHVISLSFSVVFFFSFSPRGSLGPFHGKRNFSCSPGRNPAILGKHVTALSCSPETLSYFHHPAFFLSSLLVAQLRSVYPPYRDMLLWNCWRSEKQNKKSKKKSCFPFLFSSVLFFMHRATCLQQRNDTSCKSCTTCGAAAFSLLWRRQRGSSGSGCGVTLQSLLFSLSLSPLSLSSLYMCVCHGCMKGVDKWKKKKPWATGIKSWMKKNDDIAWRKKNRRFFLVAWNETRYSRLQTHSHVFIITCMLIFTNITSLFIMKNNSGDNLEPVPNGDNRSITHNTLCARELSKIMFPHKNWSYHVHVCF